MLILTICLVYLAVITSAAADVEGNCTIGNHGLEWLQQRMSAQSLISCRGSPGQLYNAGRYWGQQYGKNASVVIFPASTQDVSLAVKATEKTPLGDGYAFVSGAHSMTNASSSYSMIIDLSYMNQTTIILNFEAASRSVPAIAYQGGSTWAQVLNKTAGTGYTAVGARDGTVGVGGFSTGGGIGFLAGAYGYAVDRLIALEVVLPSGQIVNATKQNRYSDLFWALQGGGGQFGIVTTFYQEAAPEPTDTSIGVYYLDPKDVSRAQANTVDFFDTNTDPFSLMYYSVGFLPPNLTSTSPDTFQTQTLFVALRFNDPLNPSQPSYNATFDKLLSGITPTFSTILTFPYASAVELAKGFFPYGYRRGFYGPQTTRISVPYLQNITLVMEEYIQSLLDRDEDPTTALFVMQYMFPGLNGNLPTDDSSTAWPHAVAGHQTLFSPAWTRAENDALADNATAVLNDITYRRQREVGEFIADYPNYISPGVSGKRVWDGNVERLERLKEKYDPRCSIYQGRVFASKGCIKKGRANIF